MQRTNSRSNRIHQQDSLAISLLDQKTHIQLIGDQAVIPVQFQVRSGSFRKNGDIRPVNLHSRDQTTDLQPLFDMRPVSADAILIITNGKTDIQRIKWRTADTMVPLKESMNEN